MSSFSRWCSEEVKPVPPTLPCVPQLPTSVSSKTAVLQAARHVHPSTFTPIPSTLQKPALGLDRIKTNLTLAQDRSVPVKTLVHVKDWSNPGHALTDSGYVQSKPSNLIVSSGSNEIFLTPVTGVQKISSALEKRTPNCSIISSGKIAPSVTGSSATAKVIIVHHGSKANVNSLNNSSNVKYTIVPSKSETVQSSAIGGGSNVIAMTAKNFQSTAAHSSHTSLSSLPNCKEEGRSSEASQIIKKGRDYLSSSKLSASSVFVLNHNRNSAPKHVNKVAAVSSKGAPLTATVSGRQLLTSSSKQCFVSNARRVFHKMGSSSLDEEDTEVEDFLSPSDRWAVLPKSYRGPRREMMMAPNRRAVRRVAGSQYPDTTTTDGETSGMGSSLDELVESSTESASESSCSLAVVNPSHSMPLQLGAQASRTMPVISDNSNKISNSCSKSKIPVYGREFSSSKKSLHGIPSINLDVSHSSPKSSVLFIPSSLSSHDHQLSHPGEQQLGTAVTQPTLSPLRCKSRSNTARTAPSSSSADACDALQGSSAALPKCPPVKRRGGWPKGRKRKPEIPGAKPPKAPQTAYVLFLADRRKFYDPREYTFGEITKRVAMEWNSLPQPQRDVYERRCEQEKNRYRNELQAYRQSHDFQLIMRKKRLKRALSGGNPEDSSDCTDGPEDDAPEELYCSKCDKLFSSLHNKRLHLHGRPHNRAQPVRKTRNPTPQNLAPSDYNTDNNTDYDDSSAAPSSVYSMLPHHRSSSTTSPSTSPFPPTVSSPGTSVAATSASEDEEIPVHAGNKRDRRQESRYGECSVASIAEEGNDGDLEDGAEDDETPASQPVGASLASLRAQLAEREREIRRLRLAVQKSQEQRVLLQQTLESERQRQSEGSAAMHVALSSYSQSCRDALALWTTTSALAPPGAVDDHTLLAYQVKEDFPQVSDFSQTPDSSARQDTNSVVQPEDKSPGSISQKIDGSSPLKDGKYFVNADRPGNESSAHQMRVEAHQASSLESHDVIGLTQGILRKMKNVYRLEDNNTLAQGEAHVTNISMGSTRDDSFQMKGDTARAKIGVSVVNNQRGSGVPDTLLAFSDEQKRSYELLVSDRSQKKCLVDVEPRSKCHEARSNRVRCELKQNQRSLSSTIKSTSIEPDLFVPLPAQTHLFGVKELDKNQITSRLQFPLMRSPTTANSCVKNTGNSPADPCYANETIKPSKTADQAQESLGRLPDRGESICIEFGNKTFIVSSDMVSSNFTETSSAAREESQVSPSAGVDDGVVANCVDGSSPVLALNEVCEASYELSPLLDHDYASFDSSSLSIPQILTTESREQPLSERSNSVPAKYSFGSANSGNEAATVVVPNKVILFNETVAGADDFPWSSVEEACKEIGKVANASNNLHEKPSDSLIEDSDQEMNSTLDTVNLNEDLKSPSSVQNLGDLCKAALDDHGDKSPYVSAVNWMTPNKKTVDFSNIDSDSSTDFLSYAAYNSGLSDYVYSTDTEDCCSDSMSTNATFNKLSLVDSLLEENDSRDQFSFQPNLPNVSPGQFFEDDFQLNNDNDLMDLNELLGRCLHNENFPEVAPGASYGCNPPASFPCVNPQPSRATSTGFCETTDQLSLDKLVSLKSISGSKVSDAPNLSGSGDVSAPSTSQALIYPSSAEPQSPYLCYQEQMDGLL